MSNNYGGTLVEERVEDSRPTQESKGKRRQKSKQGLQGGGRSQEQWRILTFSGCDFQMFVFPG